MRLRPLFMSLYGALTMTLLLGTAASAVGQPAGSPSPKEGFVVVNGVRLHYVDWGGSGDALVFLTPLGGQLLEQFEALAPRFTDRFRVLGLTRRGQAPSDAAASGYDVDTLVADLVGFLDAMRIRRVNLAGHSVAGSEMTRFAGRHGDRVSRLVYLDAAVDYKFLGEIAAEAGLERPRDPALAAIMRDARLASPDYTKVAESALNIVVVFDGPLQAVTYVTGDVAGKSGSPVYAILRMNTPIGRLSLPEGYGLEVFNAVQPFDTSRYAMKWDGEWHLTIEVFRDLGLAFAAVLLLIYVLVVGWFQSFKTPLPIMAAIPFSLVGILPAHAAMGAFFTATSMIGFIAGAGIVVRNSIILVDFIELRLLEGLPLEQAVVDAGAVRFRPMALTAAAMIVGAGVILFDPIFQGLAISLMAGEVASLLLSRMAVPVLYYMAKRHERTEPVPAAAPMEAAA